MDEDKAILTEEQKLKILERFNDGTKPIPTVRELILLTFGQEYDARSKFGRAIRELLNERGLGYQSAREWVPKKVIELTEEQKNFISNNIGAMKPLEMARNLFNNNELTNLDTETRAIYEYIRSLPTNISNQSIQKEALNISDYVPPKTEEQVIRRVNKYVSNINLSKDSLNEKQKRDMKSLIGYLHTMRYLSQINTYSKVDERELFESEFIRCTYDKSLTEEEVSQYIMYCTEVIIARQIDKRVQDLEEEQDRQIQENNGRPNMALVEQISALRGEFNQCINRQKASLKSLQGERKERLKLDNQNKGNIADLIVYAMSEEKRQHLLNIAAERRVKIANEIDRIKNLDDIKVEVFGIDPQEILD